MRACVARVALIALGALRACVARIALDALRTLRARVALISLGALRACVAGVALDALRTLRARVARIALRPLRACVARVAFIALDALRNAERQTHSVGGVAGTLYNFFADIGGVVGREALRGHGQAFDSDACAFGVRLRGTCGKRGGVGEIGGVLGVG